MQFTYNLTDGASSTMPCMNNVVQGYEVIADYTLPLDTVPCLSGSVQCGFSQPYAPFVLNFYSTIFAGAAATSASDVSLIKGNVTANTVTGFTNPSVTGTIYAGASDQLAYSQTLATSVYSSALAQVCTANLVGGPFELSSRTYAPGVYCLSSSAQLTGTMTLTGESTDRYTFVIPSTLTTATSAFMSVPLNLPGANVVWAIGTSATLGTASNVFGVFDALAGISCADTCVINGYLWAGTSVSLSGGASTVQP